MTHTTEPVTDEHATPTRIGGIPPRIAAVLCYLPCSPLNLIMACICAFGEPKENRFLRLHGFQILFAGAAQLISVFVFGPINGIVGMATMTPPARDPVTHEVLAGGPPPISPAFAVLVGIESVLFLAFFVLLTIALIQAARGRFFRIPVIGGLAERFA